jgi:hypothetical protein
MHISTKAILTFFILFCIGTSCKKNHDTNEHRYYFSITIDTINVTTTQPLFQNVNSPDLLTGEIRDNNIHLFAGRACQTDLDSCYTFWIDLPTVSAGTYQALVMYFIKGQSYSMGPNGNGGTVICIIDKVEPYRFFADPGMIRGTFSGKIAKQQDDPNLPETLVDVHGRFSIPDNVQ